jgi:hypothetical protein
MKSTTGEMDQPTAGTRDGDRVVVFVDILGFASLTENNPIDVHMLNAHSRPFSYGNIGEILSRPRNPLTDAFSHFHNSLKWEIISAEMKHPLTAVTFSDSVFVATNYLFEAATFAVNLMRSMLSSKVPVRMGIALGSFAALRFRSDVSADGGDHAAQFLGTAVVRAYQAEKCGIKGMRILLHPSIRSLFTDAVHSPASSPIKTVSIGTPEGSTKGSTNKAGVCHELDYWDLAPTKERSAWHAFQDMWALAPDSEKEHYHATAEAINRMRIAQGEAPLTDLRRRTLPRRRRRKEPDPQPQPAFSLAPIPMRE